MAFIILLILQTGSYFLLHISGRESHELFFILWGIVTLGIFLNNVFRLPTIDMSSHQRPDGLEYTKGHYRDRFMHNSIFINLQYLALFLMNAGAYAYILITQY
ncbi:hypothetical protein EZV73_10510 [Acidaminobacter sp. JC074]|uniref:hypothetical protein n=1 Tax=Acidaminobacter sp. JC074 TaxID=2530199 RepID=UPI001F0D880F|nr:hypothetical protein [Acidaminobacter sp. JC074]MCH4888008.1 hypothetical protein [Acidaminobacter sp. JC074]